MAKKIELEEASTTEKKVSKKKVATPDEVAVAPKKTTKKVVDSEVVTQEKKVVAKKSKKVEEDTEVKKETPKKATKKVEAKTLEAKGEEIPAVVKETVKEVAKKTSKEKKSSGNREFKSRLQEAYFTTIQKELKEELGYTSIMEAPRLVKVVLNMGIKEAVSDGKAVELALKDLGVITGQKAVSTKAKKAIAAFKIREGLAIGAKVTLRGIKMYDFIDKLVNVSLPRVRDFRGVPNSSFDGRGNYTFGVKEQLIFPEIKYDDTKIRGLDITIVTTAKDDKAAHMLLKKIGMPFAK